MLHQSTLSFLTDLRLNNNKDWFNANRESYLAAKANFKDYVELLIKGLSDFDHHLEGLSAEESVFRIYRDVRFSKNKDPYKSHFGAYFALGGRKSNYAGYYLQVKPGDCFLGGGMYKPGMAVLKKIRQEIDYNPKLIKAVLNNEAFKNSFGALEKDVLETAPHGYPKDHENIALLKYKSFFAKHSFSQEVLTEKQGLDYCINKFETLFPFIKYFNETFVS